MVSCFLIILTSCSSLIIYHKMHIYLENMIVTPRLSSVPPSAGLCIVWLVLHELTKGVSFLQHPHVVRAPSSLSSHTIGKRSVSTCQPIPTS